MENDSSKLKEDIHKNHRQRVYDRLEKDGLSSFYDHEIIEMLLFYTVPRMDTNPIAHRLINEFGSLSGVLNADVKSLMKVKGVSQKSATLLSVMPALAKRYSVDSFGKKQRLDSMEKASKYLKAYMLNEKKEVFVVVCLDGNNKIIETQKLKEGTSTELIINPRAVVVAAAQHEPASVIIAHNHPGGVASPSTEDVLCTKKIALALGVIGIAVYDHIIIGEGDVFSFRKEGIMTDIINDAAVKIHHT